MGYDKAVPRSTGAPSTHDTGDVAPVRPRPPPRPTKEHTMASNRSIRSTRALSTALVTAGASLALVASGIPTSHADSSTADTSSAARAAAAPVSVDRAPTNEVTGVTTTFNAPFDVALDASARRYVANSGNNSVTVHARDASNNAAPERRISGGLTQLSTPVGLAVDGTGWTYVTSAGNNRVLVFAPGVQNDVAPTRMITGAGSGINAPRGLALAPDGSIVVANTAAPASITVHRRTAANATPPDRTITGPATGLSQPFAVHVDDKGKIYVGDLSGKVFVFAAGANGDVAPIRTLDGATADFNQVTGVATDSDGNVYVSSFSPPHNALLVFGPTGSQPNWRLEGPASKVTRPAGMHIAKDHRVLLVNNNPAALRTYAPIAKKITKPGKVRSLKVAGKQTSKNRKVTWKKPKSDGNSPITRYKVVVKKGAKVVLTRTVTKRSTVLKRAALPRGRLVVRVSARNVKGYGKATSRAFRVRK